MYAIRSYYEILSFLDTFMPGQEFRVEHYQEDVV